MNAPLVFAPHFSLSTTLRRVGNQNLQGEALAVQNAHACMYETVVQCTVLHP